MIETENVQDPLAVSVAFARLIVAVPLAAVIAPPPHVPVRPLGLDIFSPPGSESLNPIPVSDWVKLGLLIVNVSVVAPLSGIEEAPKTLVIVGGAKTLRYADAVLPVPALAAVTAPVVFVRSPADVPFTFTLKVHDELIPILAPLNATLFDAATAVTVPPLHDPVSPFGVATTIPDGNVSVKATPLKAAVFAAGFPMVNVNAVLPLTGILP